MKAVKRLWFRALELGVDMTLINVLCKLKVLNTNNWQQYQQDSHITLIQYRQQREMKRSRQSARELSVPIRAPKSIKPTKAR